MSTRAPKYSVSSPRVAKVKSPLSKAKKSKYPDQFIYLNKSRKERNLVITKPTTDCSIEPEMCEDDLLILRSQIQTHAAKQIQKRIREFLNRQREQSKQQTENNTVNVKGTGILTLTGKSGKRVVIRTTKDPEVETISNFLEEEDQ